MSVSWSIGEQNRRSVIPRVPVRLWMIVTPEVLDHDTPIHICQ